MKKLILVVSLLSPVSLVMGQGLREQMANEVCACLQEKKLSEIKDKEEATLIAGLCIIGVYEKHQEEANKEFGITSFDEEGGEKFGTELGLAMARICPEQIVKLGMMDQESEENSKPQTTVFSGSVTTVDVSDFVSLQLKGADGKTTKCYWLEYFSGSDDFVQDPKRLKGKKVRIETSEVEVYLPSAKGYYKINQIVSLEIQ